MTLRFLVLCGVLVVSATVGRAQDTGSGPIVRIDVEPQSVTIGQPVTVRLTLLGPTWFPKPPVFPSFEMRDVVTRLPPRSSFPTSERIDGEQWSGITRSYRLYPMVAAGYEMADEGIDVTYADAETRDPLRVRLDVPPIRFEGTVPDGAEALDPFLSGTALSLDQTVEGETADLTPGSAVVRTVTASLDGMPALFLPPLQRVPDNPALSVLAAPPVVDEKPGERGGPVRSTRTETVTYVFEGDGDFVLPAIELAWWNTRTGQIERASLPAIALAVAPAPGSGGRETDRPVWVLALLGGVVLVVLPAILYWRRLKTWFDERRRKRAVSEPVLFLHVLSRIASASASDIDTAMRAWIVHYGPASGLADLARRVGDAGLVDVIAAAQAVLYAPDNQADSFSEAEHRRQLALGVKRLRTGLRRGGSRGRTGAVLRPLNP
ncbi:MAG: hypothetical protein AAGL24_00675 [Pseudomonadota bacterium]